MNFIRTSTGYSPAVFITVILLLISCIPVSADMEVDTYLPGAMRDFLINTVEITLHDKARKRDIPMKIYYPEEINSRVVNTFPSQKGPFPVIIFSHGGGGSKDGYRYLGEYWARHGYISIHPTHYGSDSSMLEKGKGLANLQVIGKMIKTPANFENRPKDVSFIIDSFDEIEKKIPGLKGKIDRTRIGAAGHSFGAYTTMALAGAFVDLPGKKDMNFGDTRIKAFIPMSPQASGRMGFDKDSWKDIKGPVMILTGTKDEIWGGEKAVRRIEPFNGMPPGNKYFINIEGAHHFTFSGGGARGMKVDSRHLDYTRKATLAFWDFYLMKMQIGKAFLDPEKLKSRNGVKAEYKRK